MSSVGYKCGSSNTIRALTQLGIAALISALPFHGMSHADEPEPASIKVDGMVRNLVWSPDGRSFAVTNMRIVLVDKRTGEKAPFSALRLFDLQKGIEKTTISKVKNICGYAFAYSFDGKMLAVQQRPSYKNSEEIQIWDLESGKLNRVIKMEKNQFAAFSMAFSPDGNQLAASFRGPPTVAAIAGVNIFDVKTGKIVQTIDGPRSVSIAYSPDSKCLVTGGEQGDRQIRLWDVQSGKLIRWVTILEEGNLLQSFAFSTDGKTLATADVHNGVRLWNLETGRAKPALANSGDRSTQVAYSRDGKYLAAKLCVPNKDRYRCEVRVWLADTGRLLDTHIDAASTIAQIEEAVSFYDLLSIAFTPDDRHIAFLREDGAVIIKPARQPDK